MAESEQSRRSGVPLSEHDPQLASPALESAVNG